MTQRSKGLWYHSVNNAESGRTVTASDMGIHGAMRVKSLLTNKAESLHPFITLILVRGVGWIERDPAGFIVNPY